MSIIIKFPTSLDIRRFLYVVIKSLKFCRRKSYFCLRMGFRANCSIILRSELVLGNQSLLSRLILKRESCSCDSGDRYSDNSSRRSKSIGWFNLLRVEYEIL